MKKSEKKSQEREKSKRQRYSPAKKSHVRSGKIHSHTRKEEKTTKKKGEKSKSTRPTISKKGAREVKRFAGKVWKPDSRPRGANSRGLHNLSVQKEQKKGTEPVSSKIDVSPADAQQNKRLRLREANAEGGLCR